MEIKRFIVGLITSVLYIVSVNCNTNVYAESYSVEQLSNR